MSSFIKNSITFLLGFILIFSLMNLLANYNTRSKADFVIKKQVDTIILGHSHSECAYNDSIISNIKNVSSSGESYFYTYFKLVNILKQNPTIKTVYVNYSNNQIDKKMDDWIWDKKHLNEKYVSNSSFIPMQDQLVLMKNNLDDYVICYGKASKKNILNFNPNRYDFHSTIGGYQYLNKTLEDSLVSTLIEKFHESNYDYQNYSQTNINYLYKMVELCKNENVRLVLVRTPTHPKYTGLANEPTYQQLLKEKLSGVEYVDFSKFKMKNKELADLVHLNYLGAQRFSKWFNEILENEILNYPINQSQIDSLIELENTANF